MIAVLPQKDLAWPFYDGRTEFLSPGRPEAVRLICHSAGLHFSFSIRFGLTSFIKSDDHNLWKKTALLHLFLSPVTVQLPHVTSHLHVSDHPSASPKDCLFGLIFDK